MGQRKLNKGIFKNIWTIEASRGDTAKVLKNNLGISEVLAAILASRGIKNIEEGRVFLNPSIKDLNNPFLMDDMEKVVLKIKDFIARGKKILIWGDYDVDGITATALLYSSIKILGGDGSYFLPSRFEGGYGLNKEDILEMSHRGIDLLITVDCGISCHNEVKYALDLGIDIIITDHHRPPKVLPQNCLILNPHKDGCPYPYKDLSGVGIAFKLYQGLLDVKDSYNNMVLPLVALGTVADLVPLTGENRVLVKLGLRELNNNMPLWAKALMDAVSLQDKEINAKHLAYYFGPRINAAGRLGNPWKALDLILSDKLEDALILASNLDMDNQKRQLIVEEIFNEAVNLIEEEQLENKAIIIYNPRWHPGVIGIVSSKLVEKYYRPVILLTNQDQKIKGSGRSIPEIDLYNCLFKCSSYLKDFGGHKMAAGLEVSDIICLEGFRKAFLDIINSFPEKTFERTLPIDMIIDEKDLSLDLAKEMECLEPFGQYNKEPIFGIIESSPKRLQKIGKNGEHMSFTLGQTDFKGVSFNSSRYFDDIKGLNLSIAGSIKINRWNGRVEPQLLVKDFGYVAIEEGKFIKQWEKYLERMSIQDIESLNTSFPNIGPFNKGKIIRDSSILAFFPSTLMEIKINGNKVTEKIDGVDFPHGILWGNDRERLYILDYPLTDNWIKGVKNALPHTELIGVWSEYDKEFAFDFLLGFYPDRKRLETTLLSINPVGLITGLIIFQELSLVKYKIIDGKIEFDLLLTTEKVDLENSKLYKRINSLLEGFLITHSLKTNIM
jgi:single-stranded-DNA-specific exonuclease